MLNYVISLKSAIQRREHIKSEFSKQNIPFQFFDAITPDMLPELDKQFNIELSKAVKLSNGEKACFSSHICLWQQMLQDNLDYVAIFEDDIFLGQDAGLWLDDLTQLHTLRNQNVPFDLIKLETFLIKVHLGKQVSMATDHRKLYALKSMHTGTGGYILSKEGAKKLLRIIQTLSATDIMPIDHLMFDGYLKELETYQISPALCIQGMFLEGSNHDLQSHLAMSRLEEKNVTDFHKSQLNTKQEARRLFKRLYRSLGKRTFFQVVEFK